MDGTEHGRGGHDDHVHAGVDDLLVGVEAHEAVLLGHHLAEFPLDGFVDWKYAAHIFERYPNAKRYKDWRVMFDEMLDQADAVMVATADHTHAIIAANAIMAGKHVYCEKPLTRTVYESRLLTKLAAKYRVATQMGNQGASGEGVRKICNWIYRAP